MGRSVVLGIVCAGQLLAVSAQRVPVVRAAAAVSATVEIAASHIATGDLVTAFAPGLPPLPAVHISPSWTVRTAAGIDLQVTVERPPRSCTEMPAGRAGPPGRQGVRTPGCRRIEVSIASVGT